MFSDINILMSTTEFGDWLNKKMSAHKLIQADLMRATGVSRGAVSQWLSGETRPSPENCRKLAKLFNYPERQLLEIAGILSPVKESDPTDQELLHLFEQLSDEQQDEIVKWVRFKVEENEGKG